MPCAYHLNIIGCTARKHQPWKAILTPDFVWQEGVKDMAVTDNQHLIIYEIVSGARISPLSSGSPTDLTSIRHLSII